MILDTFDLDEVVKARMERKEAFERIDELERIKLEIRAKTKVAIENIELGMTKEEVIKVAGRPRSIGWDTSARCEYNYGNVWVIFESGVVSCIVSGKVFSRGVPCSFHRTWHPREIIK